MSIESFGHKQFGCGWRGLETPRHLVLFNHRPLGLAFIKAGFPAPQDRLRPSPCTGMYLPSYAIEQGYSPYDALESPKLLQLRAVVGSIKGTLLPSRKEFLTVTASKKAE